MNKLKKTRKIITAFAILLYFLNTLNCFSESPSYVEGMAFFSKSKIQKGFLAGKIENNRYHAVNNFFSFAIPPGFIQGIIEDHAAAPGIFGVALYNQDGFLLKVQYDPLIEEVRSLLAYPEIEGELLDAIFYDLALLQLKGITPELKVLHERKIKLENGQNALFAILNLPESASVNNSITGTPLDSIRGYLFFFSKTHLVNLSLQTP